MSNVVLSLDGRKEVHDRYRVDYAGNGSWDRIVPKFQKLVKARGNKAYYMRGTFTHANPDFSKTFSSMLDLGFTELSMEPVVCAPGDPCRADRRRSASSSWSSTKSLLSSCWSAAAPGGQPVHVLPLHDRPHRRPVHLQAHFRAAAPAPSTWPSPRGATSTPATSSSATKNSASAMSGQV